MLVVLRYAYYANVLNAQLAEMSKLWGTDFEFIVNYQEEKFQSRETCSHFQCK